MFAANFFLWFLFFGNILLLFNIVLSILAIFGWLGFRIHTVYLFFESFVSAPNLDRSLFLLANLKEHSLLISCYFAQIS
jgi:hypothetical protein